MNEPHETGDPSVTNNDLIADILNATLGPAWSVEEIAERLLVAIASRPAAGPQEFAFDAGTATGRQSRRLIRPLLAHLATKSAEASLYGGRFCFERPGPDGPVWIHGQFENRPGAVRVTLRRSTTPPGDGPGSPTVVADHTPPSEALHPAGPGG